MDSVIINFIRSIQFSALSKLVADMSAEHCYLLLHSDVWWLSKGNLLKRVCELREEIVVFLCDCTRKSMRFCHMNAIKMNAHASLTNKPLHHCLRIALT